MSTGNETTSYGNNTSGCNLVSSSNVTFPIAPYWENIPETLFLNGMIGFVLFWVFYIVSDYAWRITGNESDEPSIINMIYGYRDPELWYVIPRYEFLKPDKRHHIHELSGTKIFVPPKLPTANPIEFLSFDDNSRDTIDSKSAETHNSPLATKSAPPPLPSPTDPFEAITTKSSKGVIHRMESGYFYPSVLTQEQLRATSLSRRLNRFFSILFRTTDADMIYAKGIDAYEYLLFQRHLIFILFVTTIFCLVLILPCHWYLGTNFKESSFQRTTMSNLRGMSNAYWAHIVSCLCITLTVIMVINSYLKSISTRDSNELSRKTLLIGNLKSDQRERGKLMRIFARHFTNAKIESIQFVYDIGKLTEIQRQLDIVMVAREYTRAYKVRHKRELMVNRLDPEETQQMTGPCRLCHFVYMSLFKWPHEKAYPGELYYAEQELYYRSKVRDVCRSLIKNPTEYAFITFSSHKQARLVLKELNKNRSSLSNSGFDITRRIKSKYSSGLGSGGSSGALKEPEVVDGPTKKQIASTESQIRARRRRRQLDDKIDWSVRYAPHPDNVEYNDLLNYTKIGKAKTFLMHTLIVVLFIFVTTPSVLLSVMDKLIEIRYQSERRTALENLVLTYATTLLQITSTSILPALITLISKQIPYEDTASKSHSIMWKTYVFLVLMVIVMPSVGMSSAQAFFSSGINPQCLFPTDNGSYYINYIISAMFLTNIIELLKPVDIITYSYLYLTSRSSADYEEARQSLEREFSVSMQHTTVLLMFSVTMTYAISCPLIAPIGLIYLFIKHSVDHYHLFYTYFTKKVDSQLQSTLHIFVKCAILLMLFQTMISITINTGTGYFSFLAQVVFFLTFVTFAIKMFYSCTTRVMNGDLSTNSSKRRKHPKKQEFCACFYLPVTIDKLLRSNAIPEDCISRKVRV